MCCQSLFTFSCHDVYYLPYIDHHHKELCIDKSRFLGAEAGLDLHVTLNSIHKPGTFSDCRKYLAMNIFLRSFVRFCSYKSDRYL